jgi:protein-S-isoprenylcysteine O-methyltransferase Ste14
VNLQSSAILAFLALPGVFGFLLPGLLAFSGRGRAPFYPIGLVPFVVGSGLLCWCAVEFYRAGRGTLAPWAPPVKLVVTGPYRWSRNPMYLAVMSILAGWAAMFSSGNVLVYAAVFAIAVHIRVVAVEEPFLARTHGAGWTSYSSTVRRWL